MNGISIGSGRVFFKIYQVVSLPGRGKHRYEVFNRPTRGHVISWVFGRYETYNGTQTLYFLLEPCLGGARWTNVFGESHVSCFEKGWSIDVKGMLPRAPVGELYSTYVRKSLYGSEKHCRPAGSFFFGLKAERQSEAV